MYNSLTEKDVSILSKIDEKNYVKNKEFLLKRAKRIDITDSLYSLYVKAAITSAADLRIYCPSDYNGKIVFFKATFKEKSIPSCYPYPEKILNKISSANIFLKKRDNFIVINIPTSHGKMMDEKPRKIIADYVINHINKE